MVTLPTVGADSGDWGTKLNSWLGARAGQPYQFWVDDDAYGAKGDGIVCTVATTASSTTVTASTAVFTSTGVDGGKHIMIHGAAGTTAGPLITTISSVTDSTHAVLASASTATVSAAPAVFGTDDTAAINSAVAAAGNFALGTSGAGTGFGNYYAEIVFRNAVYVLASGPTQTGNGTTTPTFNAQIPLPYPATDGTSRKLVIVLTGVPGAGYCQYFGSTVPNVAGASLVSMVTAPSTPDATFGNQSVVGGPSGEAGFSRVGGNTAFANVKAVIRGLSVWCPIFTNMYAWDLGYVTAWRGEQSAAHIFAPPGFNGGAQPYLSNLSATAFTLSIGTGWRTPVTANNDDSYAEDCIAEGYECSWRAFDHFTFRGLRSVYADVVMLFDGTAGSTGTSHSITGDISAEAYNGGLRTNGGTVQVDLTWDAEIASPAYDINDSGNALHGVFRFRDPANARFPTVSGGSKVKVICDELGPGHWASPPSVPATTVAQQNTAWRDAWVSVHAGSGVTVSAISVDGTSTGLTVAASSSQAVRVPSGKTVTLTYSGGTPTWDWWLD